MQIRKGNDMNDNRKLIIRKAKDGINHEAVIMDYCGGWYEREMGNGFTEFDAINDLRSKLVATIYMAERDLALCDYGRIESEV